MKKLDSRFRLPLTICCVLITYGATNAQDIFPRIINGVEIVGEQFADFEAVGVVGNRQGEFCTGTLISDIHVLTAAHCAAEIRNATDGTFRLGNAVYETVEVTIHPDFNVATLEYDVAILKLAEPVEDVAPAELFRGRPAVESELTIVGYGAGGDVSGEDGNFGTLMAGVTYIEGVSDIQVFWTFDDVAEANTAPGDSGGPGFLDVNGELQIATITSGGTRQDAGFGDETVNVRVDAFAEWIDDIIFADLIGPEEDSNDEPSDELEDEPGNDMPGHDGHRPGGLGHHNGWISCGVLRRLILTFLTALVDSSPTLQDVFTDLGIGLPTLSNDQEAATEESGSESSVQMATTTSKVENDAVPVGRQTGQARRNETPVNQLQRRNDRHPGPTQRLRGGSAKRTSTYRRRATILRGQH